MEHSFDRHEVTATLFSLITDMTSRGGSPRPVADRGSYRVRGKIWLYEGPGGWHFVSLSSRQSSVIRALHGSAARPFGSLPVTITIGATTWRTSLFPAKGTKTYLFAVNADVRRREHLAEGDTIVAMLLVP